MFAVYQGMFAAITVALAIGAAAERGRMLPAMVFSFIWSTIVYDPIACWTWNSSGWVFKLGGLDFAGGTPVHISSGAAALAYSLMLGKRRGHGTHELNYRPHNVTHIVIGTVFLWVGYGCAISLVALANFFPDGSASMLVLLSLPISARSWPPS